MADPSNQASNDPVNHPSHYMQGGVECIDAIEAALTPEEFRGYCKGNVIKYIWRERHKGGDENGLKGAWYIQRMIDAAKRVLAKAARARALAQREAEDALVKEAMRQYVNDDFGSLTPAGRVWLADSERQDRA